MKYSLFLTRHDTAIYILQSIFVNHTPIWWVRGPSNCEIAYMYIWLYLFVYLCFLSPLISGFSDPPSFVLGGSICPTAGRGLPLCLGSRAPRTKPAHARQHAALREPSQHLKRMYTTHGNTSAYLYYSYSHLLQTPIYYLHSTLFSTAYILHMEILLQVILLVLNPITLIYYWHSSLIYSYDVILLKQKFYIFCNPTNSCILWSCDTTRVNHYLLFMYIHLISNRSFKLLYTTNRLVISHINELGFP